MHGQKNINIRLMVIVNYDRGKIVFGNNVILSSKLRQWKISKFLVKLTSHVCQKHLELSGR